MKLILNDISPVQREVFQQVKALVKEHSDVISPVEIVAIFSQIIGTILAAAHHGLDTDAQSELIAKNVRHGFLQMKTFMHENEGGHA